MSTPIHEKLVNSEKFKDLWSTSSFSQEDLFFVFQDEFRNCDLELEIAIACDILESDMRSFYLKSAGWI